MDYSKLISKHPRLFSNQPGGIRIITNPDEIVEWQKRRREQLTQLGKPLEWSNIGTVLDDPYFVILRDLVEFPGGFRNGYMRLYSRAYLESGAAIVVIMPEMDGKLLLIHQYRHATRSWHWEAPRGFGETNVDSKTQAANELREEINGEASEIIDLGIFYHDAGLDGNPTNIFLAHMLTIGKSQIEEGIEESKLFSIAEVERMIVNGEITDGFTISAFTKAKLKGLI